MVSSETLQEPYEGWIPALATEDEVRQALEQAFGYRGDVTLTLKDGSKIEGYVFDRRVGKTLPESAVRILPTDQSGRRTISYSEIAALAFTGRDNAAGKSFDTWIKKYEAKKAAGEKDFGLEPERLE